MDMEGMDCWLDWVILVLFSDLNDYMFIFYDTLFYNEEWRMGRQSSPISMWDASHISGYTSSAKTNNITVCLRQKKVSTH